jgi:hypothetical protein
MTSTKAYVLPVIEVENPEETTVQPKYTDRDTVQGWNGSLISAPDGFPGDTTSDGEVYFAGITAEESVHDDAIDDLDTWLIGNSVESDVTPEETAGYLNDEYRLDLSGIPEDITSAFEELLDQLGPKYRRLTADEWAEQLNLGTEVFE